MTVDPAWITAAAGVGGAIAGAAVIAFAEGTIRAEQSGVRIARLLDVAITGDTQDDSDLSESEKGESE